MSKSTVQVSDFGNKFWWLDGKLHREDGPAVEYADGGREWWFHGEKVTEEQHRRWVRTTRMYDAPKAGGAVLLRGQAERIKELEEQRDELLEAIEAAIASGMVPGESITSGPGTKTQQGKAAAMLRAAIAKAKGEE